MKMESASISFSEGERIIIKLINGENYEGDFVKGTDKRIEIDNIYHHESESRIESVWGFYQREITSVYRLNVKDSKTKNEKKPVDSILMPREEYERLKEIAKNYIFIKCDDKSYYDAVQNLVNFESVGVMGIGSEKGRCGRITLIALSTWKEVYIFDIKSFRSKKFPSAIADILESFYIKKVVHDGGALRDCLMSSHNITMNNVFDIQVAHLFITKNSVGQCPKSLKTIGECLTEYFNFPSTLLLSAEECLKDKWDSRPLEEEKLKKFSRIVTYLVTLKEHQMGLILKDLDKAVDDYHDLFMKSTEFQMIKRLSTRECTKDIDEIIPLKMIQTDEPE